MGTHQFCLKWNNYHSNLLEVFEQLLLSQALVDVTLACEGFTLKAHKMVLSACSPFFHNLFLENPCKHPIVILKDMKYVDLKAIINFMYRGEVNVAEGQLTALLKAAETLKVKGLAESTGDTNGKINEALSFPGSMDHMSAASQSAFNLGQTMPHQNETPTMRRRKKLRIRKRARSPSNVSGSEDRMSSKDQETSEELDESDSGEVKRKLKDTLLRRLSTHPNAENQEGGDQNTSEFTTSQLQHSNDSPSDMKDDDGNRVLNQKENAEEDVNQLMEKSLTSDSVTLLPEGQVENHTSILARQLSLPPGLIAVRPMSDLHAHTSDPKGDTYSSSQVPILDPFGGETVQDSDADIKPPIANIEGTSPSHSVMLKSYQTESSRTSDNMMSIFMDSMGMLPPGGSEYQMDGQQRTPATQNQVLRGLLDVSTHGDASVYPKVVCTVCEKIFNSTSSMRRHMREQHYPDASLNFVCDRCEKVFRRKEHLLLHMKRHH